MEMQQKNIYKTVRVALWVMIATSALLPVLIAAIVATFTNGLWQLGVICAILLLLNFIAITIGWPVWYSNLVDVKKIYGIIAEGKTYMVTQIANVMNGTNYTPLKSLSPEQARQMDLQYAKFNQVSVRQKILYLISNGYLHGWKIDNEGNLTRPKEKTPLHGKCPNCGAKLAPDMKRCEYCGFVEKGGLQK